MGDGIESLPEDIEALKAALIVVNRHSNLTPRIGVQF
jgi:hypothetical protein